MWPADHRGQCTVSPSDIVVYAVGLVAILLGFNAGLLRSLAQFSVMSPPPRPRSR